MSPRLLSCRQADALYRLRKGTARAAWGAKRLPGRWAGKPWRGLPGKTLLVSAKRAEELWGVDGLRLALLLLCLAGASAAEWRPEVMASVASYHYTRKGQNEFNPGLGLGLGAQLGAWQPYGAAMVYRDSHESQARVAVAGVRYDLGAWVGLDLGAGYLRSHTYDGPAVIPSIYVGPGPVRVQVSALGTRALGITLRWSL